MAITSITVYNTQMQPVVLHGTIVLKSAEDMKQQTSDSMHTNVVVQNSDTCVIQLADSDYLFNTTAIRKIEEYSNDNRCISRINDVQTQTGNMYILGSLCNSVVTSDEPSDSVFSSSSHTLILYDGCQACGDCVKVWQLQNKLRDCQLWINGLKDCILRQQTPAAGLWQQMQLIRDWQYVDPSDPGKQQAVADVAEVQKQRWFSNTAISSDSDVRAAILNCPLSQTQLDRTKQYDRAVNLFKQYKALVAVWNFLVQQITDKVQITPAVQDYAGVDICVQKVINYCPTITGDTPSQLTKPIKLRIYAYMNGGRPNTNQGQQPAAAIPVTIQTISASQSGIGLCCTKIDTNTTINGQSYQSQLTCTHYAYRGYSMTQLTFPASCMNGQTKLAAGVKILPVMLTSDIIDTASQYRTYGTKAMSMSQYVYRRTNKTYMDQANQDKLNKWQLYFVWCNLPRYNQVSFSQLYQWPSQVSPVPAVLTSCSKSYTYQYYTPYTRVKPVTNS